MSFVALAAAQFSQFRIPQGSGFVPSPLNRQEESNERDSTPSAAVNFRTASYEYEEEDDPEPTQPPNRRQQSAYIRPNQFTSTGKKPQKPIAEEELEIEEPDRLTILLEKSEFNCDGRTG